MTPFGVFWRNSETRSVQPPGENPPEIPPPSPRAPGGEKGGFWAILGHFGDSGGAPPRGVKKGHFGGFWGVWGMGQICEQCVGPYRLGYIGGM